MGTQDRLIVRNELGELERLSEFLSKFGEEHSLPEEFSLELNLALEEIFCNIVKYGYQDKARHEIAVALGLQEGTVSLSVEDDAVAFNPLDAPVPALEGPVDTRPLGGLGVHMVRAVMDDIEYRREGGQEPPGDEKTRGDKRVMKVVEQKDGNVVVLTVVGRLDATTWDVLQRKVDDLIGRGEKLLVIDGAELSYISSSGLRVLLVALKNLTDVSGRMAVCSLSERVRHVFEITRLTSAFEILATREEAVANLKGG